jgi:hypothetical protein
MAELPLVVLAALEFNNLDLSTAALRSDLRLNLASGKYRRSDPDVAAFADEQDLIEFDGIANLSVQTLDAQHGTLARAILFAAGTKDCIHPGFSCCWRHDVTPSEGREF